MLPPPSLRQIRVTAIWAQMMRMAHSRSGVWALGIASAVVLFAVLFLQGADWRHLSAVSLRTAGAALSNGYRAAPALMLGLALAIALPILALASRFFRHVHRVPDATRRYRPEEDDGCEADVADASLPETTQPFVEIESGNGKMHCAIPGDMLRIGREDDNDIRISNGAVHRYHAAIYREDYNDWHITDLSGVEGNGLIVNGRRCCEARLSDGDLIQLGPGKLRFHAGSA